MRAWSQIGLWVVGAAVCVAVGCSAGSKTSKPGASGGSNSTGVAGSLGTSGSGNSGGTGTAGSLILGGMGGQEQCVPQMGPRCGDGMVNAATETCDDGNALPGDGCNGVCATEPNFTCPPTGGACTSSVKCGDGKRSPGEGCDDGNTTASDGCAADCSTVEPGWYCATPGTPCAHSMGVCGNGKIEPGETCDDGAAKDGDGCSAVCRVETGWRCTQPGQPCVLVPVCGNGKKEAAEECDDNNNVSDDGCSSTCHIEPGYLCPTPGQLCKHTTCGDGKKEGSECCDDGNTLSFDGCTPDCRCEPACPASGACTAKCGNGIVETGEKCDDGNTASGDGCTASCQVETGYTCSVPSCDSTQGKCSITVPVVYRDFNAASSSGGHPDFQPGYNSAGVATGLVNATWDADKKPALSSTASVMNGFMHGANYFKMWYRSPNEPGGTGSLASAPIPGTIILWDNGAGGFVNRWGANGEQWTGPTMFTNVSWCSNTADPTCTHCGGGGDQVMPAGFTCFSPCLPYGANSTQTCYGNSATQGYDGNPLFFPIDPPTAGIFTDTRSEGKVPDTYGWSWNWESAVATSKGITTPIKTAQALFPSKTHNFHFTTEVRWWFRFVAGTTMKLDFTGDDDVWVFVNGKLAVDLGGWHVPTTGSVTISNATAATYGLTDGSVYQIGIFHAERETEGSSFMLTLSGFNLRPSECVEKCGDGIVTVHEECDNGAANSDAACGACTTSCNFGPRCGDGITQTDCGEACDDGVNIGGYNQCGTGCKLAERCGDGIVQSDFGELCDDGPMNGVGGNCTVDCGVPAFCGDGVVQAGEQCDNGTNDNSYGGCSTDCKYGPRCGDGVPQTDFGEECDQGTANMDGVYGGCTTQCKAGPHCGDGVKDPTEECDPGAPIGSDMMSVNGCSSQNSSCDDTCHLVPLN